MINSQLILEFGDQNNTINELFHDHKIITLTNNEVSKIRFFKEDIKFVVVNTSVLNGSSAKLIQDIRKYYAGTIIVFVAAQDASLSKKFVEAGASDIMYLGDVSREKVDSSLEYCTIKQRCETNMAKVANL